MWTQAVQATLAETRDVSMRKKTFKEKNKLLVEKGKTEMIL